jgi:hypothetical protein
MDGYVERYRRMAGRRGGLDRWLGRRRDLDGCP